MKKAILHIGTPKTGSTSIQAFLAAHRKILLAEHKVLFPKSIGPRNHMGLPVFIAPFSGPNKVIRKRLGVYSDDDVPKFQEEFRNKLSIEMADNEHETLLISSEHLFGRLQAENELQELKAFILEQGYEPTIIAYFRRQDTLLPSLISTLVKVGNTRELGPSLHMPWFNYYDSIGKWASVFGKENVVCKPFEKRRFQDVSLLDGFLRTFGVSMEESKTYEGVANLSLGVEALSFLREFNRQVPLIAKDGKINVDRSNMVPLLLDYQKTSTSMSKLRFSAAQNREVLERYAEQNENLRSHFGVDLDLSVEDTGIEDFNWSNLPLEGFYNILAFLWSRKNNEVNDLNKRLVHLKTRNKKLTAEARERSGRVDT